MKKIIRMAAMLTVAGAALLSSCTKDYGTDIEQLQKENAALQSAVNSLEGQIKSGAIITSVTSTAQGVTIATTNGSYTINNGAAGKDGKDGTVIDVKDGYWTINGEKTEWKVVTDEDSVKAPFVNEDGLWVFYNEDGEEVVSTHRVAPVTAVKNEDGSYTLTIYNAEGEATVVKLPTAASSITDLIILDETAANTKVEYHQYTFTMPMNKAQWKGPRELPRDNNGQTINIIADVTATPIKVQVNPSDLEVKDVEFFLVNSKNGRPSDVTLTLAEDKGLISRAYGNGLYTVSMEDVLISTSGTAMANFNAQFLSGVAATPNVAYALTAGGNVRSKYLVGVYPSATAKTVTAINIGTTAYATVAANTAAYETSSNTAATAHEVNIGQWYKVSATDVKGLYDMYLHVDDNMKTLYGIELKNEAGDWQFRITKTPDTITVADFNLYVDAIDKSGKVYYTKLFVKPSNRLSGAYVADPIVHTIKTVAAQNVFDVDLAGMHASLGSDLTLWKTKVDAVSYSIYEKYEGGVLKNAVAGAVIAAGALLDPAHVNAFGGAAAIDAASALHITINNPVAPATSPLTLNTQYYIEVTYKKGTDVLNSMIIPVTFVAPKLAELFEIKTGYVDPADGVINAYFYNTTAATVAARKQIEITKYFSKFEPTAELKADTQTPIATPAGSFWPVASNALLTAIPAGTPFATGAGAPVVYTGAMISLNTTPVSAADPQFEAGYGQALILTAEKNNFAGWAYATSADGKYTFKLRIASPIEQGSIKPVSGSSIVISGNDLVAGAKIGADAIKGYDYNNNAYNVVPDKVDAVAGPPVVYNNAWANEQIAGVGVGPDTNNYIQSASVKPATLDGNGNTVNGHFAVKGNSISQTVEVKMPVTVADVWNYSKKAEVPVTIQKN